MKHCIIVKYNDSVTSERKLELIGKIQELFNRTTEISGINYVTLRPNIINRANRYDLVIEIDMDPAALPVYDACIWHHKWKDEYGSLLASKAIIDLE